MLFNPAKVFKKAIDMGIRYREGDHEGKFFEEVMSLLDEVRRCSCLT